MTFIETVSSSSPVLSPIYTVILGIFGPAVLICIHCSIYTRNDVTKVENERFMDAINRYLSSYPRRLAKYYLNRSYFILLFCFLIALAMTVNQALYIKDNMTYGSDISYYLRVNIADYSAITTINNAQTTTSYKYVVGTSSFLTFSPLADRSNSIETATPGLGELLNFRSLSSLYSNNYHSNNTDSTDKLTHSVDNRRLDDEKTQYHGSRALASSSSTFLVVYHLDSWRNIFDSSGDFQRLRNICLTENRIRTQMTCLSLTSFYSALTTLMSADCAAIIGSTADFSSDEISAYFEDDFTPNNPSSSVLLSYFQTGTCADYSSKDLFQSLNDLAEGDVQVSFLQKTVLNNEFSDAVLNAIEVSIEAGILATIVMIVWMRGLLCGLMTLLCICISAVVATGLLPVFKYHSFSAFNVMSVFILLGIGGNAVLLFHSAWRMSVAAGASATTESFLSAYRMIGAPFLFIVCAACMGLFSKLISPVIVISQLGAFLGCAVLIFYVEFHYLWLPAWILTSKIHFPLSWHQSIDKRLRESSGNWISWSIPYPAPDNETYDNGGEYNSVEADRLDNPASQDRVNHGEIATVGAVTTYDDKAMPIAGPVVPQLNSSFKTGPSPAETTFEAAEVIDPSKPHRARTLTFPTIYDPMSSAPSEEQSQRRRTLIYRTAYIYRVCILLSAMVCVYLVYRYTVSTYAIDFGIPQLMPENSNLGQILTIIKDYKSDLLTSSIPSSTSGIINRGPTQFPTLRPSIPPTSTKRPSSYPTNSQPTNPTLSLIPTCLPSFNPTLRPSITPSISPSVFTSRAPSSTPSISNGPSAVVSSVPSAIPSIFTSSPSSVPSQPTSPSPTSPSTASPSAGPSTSLRPSASQSDSPSPAPSTSTFVPTASQSISPSSTPSIQSFAPSALPSNTRAPTICPSIMPTWIPTTKVQSTSYTVSTCWGVSYEKPYIDSDPALSYDDAAFQSYATNPNSAPPSSLVDDLRSLCDYVDDNRWYLHIDPTWDVKRDCVYYQLVDLAQSALFKRYFPTAGATIQNTTSSSQQYMLVLLMLWAAQTTESASLLGVIEASTTIPLTVQSASTQALRARYLDSVSLSYEPLWLCANFSAKSNVSSFLSGSGPALASELIDRWHGAVDDYGSTAASKVSVATLMGSAAFSLALLASEVLTSIELAALITVAGIYRRITRRTLADCCSLVGFVFLLFVFSWGDVLVTLTASLILILILALTICCHLNFLTRTVDLLDVVVLIAIVGMMVDLPVHFLLHSQHQRGQPPSQHDSSPPLAVEWTKVSPTLMKTSWHMRHALLGPLVLSLCMSLPLFLAELAIVRKTGEYIFIVVAISYLVTIVLFPSLLSITIGAKKHMQYTWGVVLAAFFGKARSYSGNEDNMLPDQTETNKNFDTESRDEEKQSLSIPDRTEEGVKRRPSSPHTSRVVHPLQLSDHSRGNYSDNGPEEACL